MPSSRGAASGPHASSVEQEEGTGSVALAVSKRQVLKANRRLSDRESEHFRYPPNLSKSPVTYKATMLDHSPRTQRTCYFEDSLYSPRIFAPLHFANSRYLYRRYQIRKCWTRPD